jgi:hypothetical protein
VRRESCDGSQQSRACGCWYGGSEARWEGLVGALGALGGNNETGLLDGETGLLDGGQTLGWGERKE